MPLPPNATGFDRGAHYVLRVFCGLALIFLIAPIIAIIPLSFNAEPYFTYPMPGLSLRWYTEVFYSPDWQRAFRNSVVVGCSSTVIATALGTLAALGLSRHNFPHKSIVTFILISPVVIPIIIIAVGLYYFFAAVGLTSTLLGLVLAHSVLGVPFVVITVSAALTGLDTNLLRAASGLGAGPLRVFFRITLPLILPGVISGAILAFVISWDELVIVLLLAGVEEHTIPRRMWTGLRESINPSILAAATMLIVLSIVFMTALEIIRRRNERFRGKASGGPH